MTRRLKRRTLLKGTLATGAASLLGNLGVSGHANPLAASTLRLQVTPRLGPLVEPITGIGLNFPHHLEVWKQISSDLQALGLRVEVQHVEALTWLERTMTRQDFGHITGTVSGASFAVGDETSDPDLLLYNLLHSDNAVSGGDNPGKYRNPGYDKIVGDQRVELDQNKRIPMVKQAQHIIAQDVPMWTVYYQNFVLAYNSQEWTGPVERFNAGILRWNNHYSYTQLRSRSDKRVFRVVNNHDGSSINPFYATGGSFNRDTMRWVYDTLARGGLKGEVVPWAARTWRWVNPTTIEIRLRPNMKFHDGRPVTAEDVRFTFEYVKQHNFPTWRLVNSIVDRAELVNPETVRLVLRRPYAAFEAVVLTFAFIIPKHIWERVDNPRLFPNDQPVGSGFFKFGRWRRNEEWLFVANKEHWTPPAVDVLVTVIPAQGTWAGQLETKELDATAIWVYGTENIARLESQRHMKVVESPGTTFWRTYLDVTRKPFDDRTVRQALFHAINKTKTVDLVFGKRGGTVAGSTFLHPSLAPWYNDRVQGYEYSPAKARQMLRDAGYNWDDQGRLHYPS